MYDKKHDPFFDEETPEKAAEKNLISMLENYDKNVKEIKTQERVSGKIIKISDKYAYVEIGGKNEAVVDLTELKNKDGEITIKVGDIFNGYVISTSSGIMLSKHLSAKDGAKNVSLRNIIEAMKSKLPVEGKVTGINKGGYNVKVLGFKAFCPMSHIDIKHIDDHNSLLNKTFSFIIERVEQGGRNIVVSRLPILEQELKTYLDKLTINAQTKTPISGTITKIMPFGIFVDIGGIEGLVHVSEISWEKTQDLSKSFEIGQKVECIILEIEKKEPVRESKISLSIKQTQPDPWKTVTSNFSVGQIVDGIITRVVPFGAFVQLAPGIEGLIHISELSWSRKIKHPKDVVTEGQNVKVTILGINPDKKEIACSLKDISNDPWNKIEEKFPIGSKAVGVVENSTRFGYFINLADGITGLLPFSNISQDKKDSLKTGNTVEVVIEQIDTQRRRISLSYGISTPQSEKEEMLEYFKENANQTIKASTELGEVLKKALSKRQQ